MPTKDVVSGTCEWEIIDIMTKTAQLSFEARRLASKEDNWNLVTGTSSSTRTRGGGNGRPNIDFARARNERIGITEVGLDDASTVEEPLTEPSLQAESSASSTDGTESKKTKPTHSRVIVDVSQLDEVFGRLGCPECGGPIKVNIRTVCIASTVAFQCLDDDCILSDKSANRPEPSTTIHFPKTDNIERSTDYALNVLYVLGFISVGDGCTEAARLLGILGLPNDTTMESRSFTIIEERLVPIMRELLDDILRKNLVEEVKASMPNTSEEDMQLWMEAIDNKDIRIGDAWKPKVQASYDMAWQQKGSGHVYNSLSGHGTFIGRHSRKVIALVLKCKTCNFCNAWKKKFRDLDEDDEDNALILQPPPHHCWKNHEGSSGSMESAGCLQLVIDMYDKYNVIIERLCCDDDSSIRADCQWSNADYMKNHNTTIIPMVPKKVGVNKGKMQPRPDKGKLPGHIPEPLFVADPNHRRKVLSGELIAMDKSTVDKRLTMTRMDSVRISKNFSYMAKTLRDRPQCEFINAATSVLEHHFDIHNNCGDWCKRKHLSEAQRLASPKYYRCQHKDAKLYTVLQSKIARFITIDKLQEMAHGLDTNMNEAFNGICTWFAPKNKVYAGSGSLQNRIVFAVGVNSLGFMGFYKRLFKKLGIAMTPNVEHFLVMKEASRIKKLHKLGTSEAKKQRNKRKYDKLKEHTRQAKKEYHKRQGTYRKGMNLDDPFGEMLNGREEPPEDERKPRAKRCKTSGFCEYCGRSDHLTKRSKKCTASLDTPKRYRKVDGSLLSAPPSTAPVIQEEVDPPNDPSLLLLAAAAVHDTEEDDAPMPLPFTGEDSDDSDDTLAFIDCETWESDDEDSNINPTRLI
jgi:hypothetical protein